MSDVPEEVILRRFVYEIVDSDGDVDVLTAVQQAADRINNLEESVTGLRGRVAELEEHRDAISDISREKTTKEEKVAPLVTWAQQQASDDEADCVALKMKDIIGCTAVSRPYAYDLIDEFPDRYDWLHDRDDLTQYGDIEIDRSSRSRALVVDLAQLHTDESDVNTFTTRTGGTGVQT